MTYLPAGSIPDKPGYWWVRFPAPSDQEIIERVTSGRIGLTMPGYAPLGVLASSGYTFSPVLRPADFDLIKDLEALVEGYAIANAERANGINEALDLVRSWLSGSGQ